MRILICVTTVLQPFAHSPKISISTQLAPIEKLRTTLGSIPSVFRVLLPIKFKVRSLRTLKQSLAKFRLLFLGVFMEKLFPKMLRLNDVMRATGLKKSSIYNKMKLGGKYFDADFPAGISLSNTGRGAVAWNEFSIQEWIEKREAAGISPK